MRKRQSKAMHNGHDRSDVKATESQKDQPPEEHSFVSLGELSDRKQSWLWPGFILADALNMLDGKKATGKSTIQAAAVAYVLGGQPLPGCAKRKQRRSTAQAPGAIWLGSEEGYAAVVKRRLVAAGADANRVFFGIRSKGSDRLWQPRIPGDLRVLEEWIRECCVKIMVLDPAVSFANPGLNMNNEQDARRMLEPLAELAERMRVTILLSRHPRKGNSGPAIDQGLGSTAIGNVARSVLRVERCADNPDQRFIYNVATNGRASPRPQLFSIEDADDVGRIKWGEESEQTPEQLAEKDGDVGERDARSDARRFLRNALEKDPVPAKDLEKQADEAGIRSATLRRAKVDLGIPSEEKVVDGRKFWVWKKPLGGFPKEGK